MGTAFVQFVAANWLTTLPAPESGSLPSPDNRHGPARRDRHSKLIEPRRPIFIVSPA